MSVREDNSELLEALDLEAWLEREGRSFRKSRGASGMQLNPKECPNCGDSRYRTYLNADTGRGNCFICNETFNKAKFIHLALGHDTGSKGDWAATFKHIREVVRDQGWRPRNPISVAVIYPEAKLPESYALPTPDGRNLQYLEERGIKAPIAKYFHLRYCVNGKWIFTKEDGTEGWQRFNGRVIIPVFDLDGTFKTYQGRDVTGLQGDKKYLFPKGLPGTGRYLLNGHNAKGIKRVAMGEGFFDVAAMKIAFDEEPSLRSVVPIGSFGKHLSGGSPEGDDQLGRFLQLKNLGLEEVTIMWDGEEKALEAALDAAELLRKIGLKVRIALLPFKRDPNEVPPQVVRDAFFMAKPYSTGLRIELSIRNPYKGRR